MDIDELLYGKSSVQAAKGQTRRNATNSSAPSRPPPRSSRYLGRQDDDRGYSAHQRVTDIDDLTYGSSAQPPKAHTRRNATTYPPPRRPPRSASSPYLRTQDDNRGYSANKPEYEEEGEGEEVPEEDLYQEEYEDLNEQDPEATNDDAPGGYDDEQEAEGEEAEGEEAEEGEAEEGEAEEEEEEGGEEEEEEEDEEAEEEEEQQEYDDDEEQSEESGEEPVEEYDTQSEGGAYDEQPEQNDNRRRQSKPARKARRLLEEEERDGEGDEGEEGASAPVEQHLDYHFQTWVLAFSGPDSDPLLVFDDRYETGLNNKSKEPQAAAKTYARQIANSHNLDIITRSDDDYAHLLAVAVYNNKHNRVIAYYVWKEHRPSSRGDYQVKTSSIVQINGIPYDDALSYRFQSHYPQKPAIFTYQPKSRQKIKTKKQITKEKKQVRFNDTAPPSAQKIEKTMNRMYPTQSHGGGFRRK